MRRNPAKAIAMLDAMLEFFDGGRRWMTGSLGGGLFTHQRCLVGALRHVRRQLKIRGAGTEHYLRCALIDVKPSIGLLKPGVLDGPDFQLMRYNDSCWTYDELRTLIVAARAIAEAEHLDAAGAPRTYHDAAKSGVSQRAAIATRRHRPIPTHRSEDDDQEAKRNRLSAARPTLPKIVSTSIGRN